MTRLHILIPARLGSTRLPEKPLQPLGHSTLIGTTLRNSFQIAKAMEELGLTAQVCVATDDARVQQEVLAHGGQAILTPSELQSGTDRIAWALGVLCPNAPEGDLVLNIQGDEPFLPVADAVSLVRHMSEHPQIPMGTLAFERSEPELFFRTSVVKALRTSKGFAAAFSRAPLPWPTALLKADGSDWLPQPHLATPISFLHHCGVYAYRMGFLKEFAKMPPSPWEERERLEQLRALDAGVPLWVALASEAPFGIDTPQDLERARARLGQG